jgi:hypothetical protein
MLEAIGIETGRKDLIENDFDKQTLENRLVDLTNTVRPKIVGLAPLTPLSITQPYASRWGPVHRYFLSIYNCLEKPVGHLLITESGSLLYPTSLKEIG